MEKLNKFLNIPYDVFEYYKYDNNSEDDKNLMENMRYSILNVSKKAFKMCTKNSKDLNTKSQEKCIKNYFDKMIEYDINLYNKN